jgi:predicted ATPase
LHDALMARLDRLGTAKEVAQLGATLGPEFTYEEMNQPQGDPMRKMT